jgi:hypothetical protein
MRSPDAAFNVITVYLVSAIWGLRLIVLVAYRGVALRRDLPRRTVVHLHGVVCRFPTDRP